MLWLWCWAIEHIDDDHGDDVVDNHHDDDTQVDAEAVDITASVRDLPTVSVLFFVNNITILITIITIITRCEQRWAALAPG